MWSRVTVDGTAMSEASLCDEHFDQPFIVEADAFADGAEDVGDRMWHLTSANDYITCVVCGKSDWNKWRMTETYDFLKNLRIEDWKVQAILEHLGFERPVKPEIVLSDHKATFIPQAWVNDYAIRTDPEEETEWVISQEALAEWRSYAKRQFIDEAELYEETRHNDSFKDDPAAPEWVRLWHGPFEVEVEKIV